MNEGVKILIERMKTNPEEFIDYPTEPHIRSKWGEIISDHVVYLDPEDREALNQAVAKIHQQRFTEKVMTELLAPEEDNSLGKPWYTKQGSITLSAGQTPSPSIPSMTLEASEHLRAHLNALHKEKKHQTLFGKLFNYS